MSEFIGEYKAPQDLLKGKVILVTGAGDGIGKTAAKTFAAHGATVILLGRTTAKLEMVYDEIEAAGGPQPAIFPMDLNEARIETFEHFAEAVDQEFGRLDGLLHNASLLGQRTPIANYHFGTWQQVMQVNVNAAFGLTKTLLPLLEKSEAGSIVFTSSSVGLKGRAYWGAYSVSKFATEGLMQVLADELDGVSNVRANSINPGATRTNMRAAAYPAEDPQTVTAPEAIMPTYLYLMGDDSRGVSGKQFNAQGS
ncbi:YciK family oxidoreductase [Microbulbifer marinus]|uniref:NAD(P)-dependent dehydrogenase, short-chain alcohol dehydrogenase family n=1 Tax=Microbulbifer marinus TaxID=658218 RepID=A0A1H3WH79_9GAMM|nr:YciK family oxidoreductase [Microbulbifer marinus]SDZ86506.1 NAD(P)-dependent dehydrogenase, short-chain alcohol dehydrogenase family [Microbulbifer marinus]